MRNRRTPVVGCHLSVLGFFGGIALLAAFEPQQAAAQAPAGFGTPASMQINNPAVSPFLNLTQPGINPGVAFQTLVQPQLQYGNALASQQQQIGGLQNSIANPRAVMLLPPTPELQTGHVTTFMNTFSYFPTTNTRQSPFGH